MSKCCDIIFQHFHAFLLRMTGTLILMTKVLPKLGPRVMVLLLTIQQPQIILVTLPCLQLHITEVVLGMSVELVSFITITEQFLYKIIHR